MFDVRVSLDSGGCRIHLSIDELIVDGRSLAIVLRDWARYYRAPERLLRPLELSFRDYVVATKSFETSSRTRHDLAYWLGLLERIPSGPVVALRQAPPPAGAPGPAVRRLEAVVDAAVWTSLKTKAGALAVSPTVLVLAVFAEFLCVHASRKSFSLLLTLLNRPPLHPEIEELVGPALATGIYMVAGGSAASPTMEQLVQAAQQQVWRMLDHASVSAVRVVREMRRRGSPPADHTLSTVFTSLLEAASVATDCEPLGPTTYFVNQTPQISLDHQVMELDGNLLLSWDVDADVHSLSDMERLFSSYCDVLRALADEAQWQVPPQRLLSAHPAVAATTQAFPLTDQQQAYAYARQTVTEGSGNCRFYQALQVNSLDIGRLEEAWMHLVRLHPMLRAQVRDDGTQVVQDKVASYSIRVYDLQTADAAATAEMRRGIRAEMLMAPAAPADWPCFDIRVFQLDGDRFVLHCCFDLLVIDARSIGLLLGQLITRYRHGTGPRPPRLGYADYVVQSNRLQRLPEADEKRAYWHRKFAKIVPQSAAFLGRGTRGGEAPFRLARSVTDWGRIKQHAARLGVPVDVVLLAAFSEVLFDWNGGQAITVAVSAWDRLALHADIDEVVGDFTAMAWVTRAADGLAFDDRVIQCNNELMADLAQRPVSGLVALRRDARWNRSRAAPFPFVFTRPFLPVDLEAADLRWDGGLTTTPGVLIDNVSYETAGGLVVAWDFSGNAEPHEVAAQIFEGYVRMVELLASDGDCWRRGSFGEVTRGHARNPSASVAAG